ncbi:MAG: penicillin-binding protein 2 [Actinomycetota bacterium]
MRLVERRIGLLFAAFFLCFAVILARALWLQGVRGGALASEATSQQTELVTVPGLRGRVLDRRGQELAVSEDAASVYATPYQVKDPERTASRLASVLDVSRDQLLKGLTANSGFSYLAHKVDVPAAEKIKQMKLAGIGTLPDSRRTYPQGNLAAQVLGAVGSDNQGLSGLEAGQQSVLGGTDGQERIVKDALGEPIRLETVRGASDGHDIKTTIDAAIQAKTEQVIASVGQQYAAKGATAIVMDPRSSQILAMANWPGVDLNNLASASSSDLENQATGFTYEPGSTFKAFTVAGALEDHVVTPDTTFHLQPTIQVADRTIEDAEPRGPVDLSVAQILAQSSNVGAVTIGLQLGATKFSRWVSRFGFGRPTGIQFPAEERGIVPSYADYSGSSIGNLPIGQGLSVTPIQMMAAYAAIANGGILRRPQLLEQVDGQPVTEPAGHRVIKAGVAAEIRQMLEGVLAPGGTASEVSVPGYTLAGKTGTAQVAENGGYSETKFVASFMGFAPAANPGLLVAVIVDEPQGAIYSGGSVAAPAFGQIASFALPYLGIAPN